MATTCISLTCLINGRSCCCDRSFQRRGFRDVHSGRTRSARLIWSATKVTRWTRCIRISRIRSFDQLLLSIALDARVSIDRTPLEKKKLFYCSNRLGFHWVAVVDETKESKCRYADYTSSPATPASARTSSLRRLDFDQESNNETGTGAMLPCFQAIYAIMRMQAFLYIPIPLSERWVIFSRGTRFIYMKWYIYSNATSYALAFKWLG